MNNSSSPRFKSGIISDPEVGGLTLWPSNSFSPFPHFNRATYWLRPIFLISSSTCLLQFFFSWLYNIYPWAFITIFQEGRVFSCDGWNLANDGSVWEFLGQRNKLGKAGGESSQAKRKNLKQTRKSLLDTAVNWKRYLDWAVNLRASV